MLYTNFFMFGLNFHQISTSADFNNFPHFRPPVIEKVEKSEQRFLLVWQTKWRSAQIWDRSVQFHIFRRQVALQMCRSYAGVETYTRRKVWTPLPLASKDVQQKNSKLHSSSQSSTRVSIFIALTYFIVEKLRVKLWKRFENREIGKDLGTHMSN